MIVLHWHFGAKGIYVPNSPVVSIHEQIDFLIETMRKYVPEEVYETVPCTDTHITQLMVRGFDGIVATCKEELEEADGEHVAFILKTMCNINITDVTAQQFYLQIEEFLSRFIDPINSDISNEYMALSEKNMVIMIQLLDYAREILKGIESQLNQFKAKRFSQWRYGTEINSYQTTQKELSDLIKALESRLEIDADRMIDRIVDNFYMIYICFLSLYKYAELENGIVDYVMLLSQIDRILYIIDPSLQGNTLKNKYLLYYHFIYELKEFRHILLEKF